MQVLPATQMSMPSPTLTNPDMILPLTSSSESSPSASTRPQQFSSPPSFEERQFRSGSMENRTRVKPVGHSLSPFRNGVLSHRDGPTRARSNSERGGDGRIKYDNSRLSYRPSGDVPIASSPTLRDDYNISPKAGVSASPVQDDEIGQTTYSTPSILEEDENDPTSHAAMTRRAEEILANAKKRLTNMEGNLERARSTLNSRPSSSMSSFTNTYPEPASLYSLSRTPSKHRQMGTALDENKQGHSRVFSETSVPSSLNTGLPNGPSGGGTTEPARNWFWNGLTRSTSLANRHNNALQPLTEDGPAPESFERRTREDDIDEEEEVSYSRSDQRLSAASAFNAQNPPATGLTRARSTHQMRDLRDQMSDLKGKISTLKQRAKEDNLRRRSLQSLRTPSPFTAADEYYTGIPLVEEKSLRIGLGLLGVSDPEGHEAESTPTAEVAEPVFGDENHNQIDRDSGVGLQDQTEEATNPTPSGPDTNATGPTPEPQSQANLEPNAEPVTDLGREEHEPRMTINHVSEEMPSEENAEGMERNDDKDSILEDQDYHETSALPVGERHEDRADAFDYEHFFLHSGMGSYAKRPISRTSSHSSMYSVETTKPSNAMDEAPKTNGKHLRNGSVESISTVATFATATEGRDVEVDEGELTPRRAASNGKINGSPRKAFKRGAFTPDNGSASSTSSPDLLSHLAAFAPPKEGMRGKPFHLTDSDKELAERLVRSLVKVCSELDALTAEGVKYEARVCRRKLDAARRYLDGEVNGEA